MVEAAVSTANLSPSAAAAATASDVSALLPSGLLTHPAAIAATERAKITFFIFGFLVLERKINV
jgi:hypothetical protein